MKKLIIPRRDHEVYFIPMPKEIKPKQLRPFVIEQLDRLHPGFSASSVFDIKQFIFNETHWIMVTVMEAEILAEYKILHKGAVFYTNTSIAAYKTGFSLDGVNTIDDELIGFDTEKNMPVTIPLETGKTDSTKDLSARLRTIPSRHGVFVKRMPRSRITAIIASAAMMILLSSIAIIPKEEITGASPPVTNTETMAEIKFPPQAAAMLAMISSDLVEAGGIISRWQYNEDLAPSMLIQIRGIDVLTAHRVFGHYEYVNLQDIQNVRYIDNEPQFTVYLSAAGTEYPMLGSGAFPAQSSTIPMITDLTDKLKQQKVIIISEEFPAINNGNAFYIVTYNAKDRNLIGSMEIITDICNEYQFRIRSLDVSIDDNNIFTVICKLSQLNVADKNAPGLGNEKGKIPAAFGYREKLPTPAAIAVKVPEKEPASPIIGSIKDGNGELIFYRDTGNGKIKLGGIGEK